MKILLVASVVFSVLALMIPGGKVALEPSQAASTPGVAHFREVQISYGSEGTHIAATEAWRTKVLLMNEQRVVGTGGIACIHVTRVARECYGTYTLPQGRIKIEGEITNRQKFQLVIIGGTGVYSGAEGVVNFAGLSLVTFYIT